MKHFHFARLLAAVASGLLLSAVRNQAQTTVFDDTFSSSTLNSATPGSPTANSTSYEIVSTEALTTSSIGAGHLDLGFGTGSGNGYQVQALFGTSPVTLASIGDYVELSVTFTDSGGFLTAANGTLCAGLYNTGQVGPVAGGVANENSANTDHPSGGAQDWLGYTGQIVTNHSYVNLRAAQTGTGNNNQDTSFGGNISATKGYNNPMSSLGTNGQGAVLTLGNQYTMTLTYELSGANTLVISNSLYAGADTTGALVSEFDTVAAGANYLTNSFDGLAFGFYANKNQTTTMDINQITIGALIQPVPEPTTLALAGLGLIAFGWRIRRR